MFFYSRADAAGVEGAGEGGAARVPVGRTLLSQPAAAVRGTSALRTWLSLSPATLAWDHSVRGESGWAGADVGGELLHVPRLQQGEPGFRSCALSCCCGGCPAIAATRCGSPGGGCSPYAACERSRQAVAAASTADKAVGTAAQEQAAKASEPLGVAVGGFGFNSVVLGVGAVLGAAAVAFGRRR
jgi:hypothetical protein